MPTFLPVCMTPGSMNVLPSRMQADDRRGVDEDLERQGAARAVGAGHELLRHDAAQRLAHHDADLVALVDREHVEHAVERAGGAAGVQGAQHQVAGFGGGDGQRNRLQVAHFPDHDHVRIFAQGARARPRRNDSVCVCTSRWLTWQLFESNDVFDRILQGDDVVLAVAVD